MDLLRTWTFSFYEGPASVSVHLSPVVQSMGFSPLAGHFWMEINILDVSDSAACISAVISAHRVR